MSSAILEIQDVTQSFRTGFWLKRAQILDGISFNVPARSIFGFLGANGAGKTTLIHLIVGLRKPVSGSVRVLGKDASSLTARASIGYLPERPYFHDHLTGEGMLRYFGDLSGMSRSKVMDRIPQVLSTVNMSHARKVELRKYSKGMLQRIGIAQALLHDPEFLVLDEPMSGLDPMGRKEIRELIVKLATEGRTVFFSSHVIPDVEAICDQVALIQKGKMLGCGPIGKFLSQGPIQTEIAFSGLTEDQVSRIAEIQSFRQIPDAFRAVVASQEAVQIVLQKLIAEGARVLWVSPIRPSLENLFGMPSEAVPAHASRIEGDRHE